MYTDPQAEKLLADVLIQRRDKIAHAYLNAINPVVNVALDGSGALTFDNAAVGAGVAEAPAGGYVVHWSRFDNNTGTATEIGTSTADRERPHAGPVTAGGARLLHQGRDPRRSAGARVLGHAAQRFLPPRRRMAPRRPRAHAVGRVSTPNLHTPNSQTGIFVPSG